MSGIRITEEVTLAADPTPRVSQAGKAWVTFRAAFTPRVRDRQSGEWSDGETTWFNCRAFGDLADHIVQSLTKGTRVLVQGTWVARVYTDNEGKERTSLDLEVEAVGPSLKFATATVVKASSRGSGGGWGAPAGAVSQGAGYGAQEPFGEPF